MYLSRLYSSECVGAHSPGCCCEVVGSPRSSHTVKVTELNGNISYYINTPAPSLCPGKVPLLTLVWLVWLVIYTICIRYYVNNDLCNAWNVTAKRKGKINGDQEGCRLGLKSTPPDDS